MLVTASAGQVIGVGYQGRDVDAFRAGLVRNGVSLVVDVRLTPVSRKPGFSKRALAAALDAVGIGYEHAAELGNPKWNRPGFAGTAEELNAAQATYASMLASQEAQVCLDELATAATRDVVAVLCFEEEERRCHRRLVLDEVHSRLSDVGRTRLAP